MIKIILYKIKIIIKIHHKKIRILIVNCKYKTVLDRKNIMLSLPHFIEILMV